MWLDCPGCSGTGTNPVEGTCPGCFGEGVVFKQCCGCRDCSEKSGDECPVDTCPKDHEEMPVGAIPRDRPVVVDSEVQQRE